MKLLIVLGEGGHTTEMLNLVDLLGDRYEYHYIITKEDFNAFDRYRYISRTSLGEQTGQIYVDKALLFVNDCPKPGP